MLISNPLKKLHKTHAKITNEKVKEKLSFLLLLLCKKVYRQQFFEGNFFVLFSTDSISACNFAFHDTQIEF